MNIGQMQQTLMPKRYTVEPATAKQPTPPQENDSKQLIKETVQRQLSEMQEARTDMGEDNPKAQRFIEKFKSGKKLTPDEMAYIRKHAPGMVSTIDRVMREREVIELSMQIAPTKTDVQLVAFRAAKQIEKHPNPDDRELRAKHLADAKHEYEKTDEYKEKPSSPLHADEPRVHVRAKRSDKHSFSLAKSAYTPTTLEKKESTIQYER